MHLDQDQEGYSYYLCVSSWKQTGKKPSVRFTAFKVIQKIARKYP